MRPMSECSVDHSSELGSDRFFSDGVCSESSLLGLLVAGYFELPLFLAKAWNNGCRVAMQTVMMAVPASTNDKTAKSSLCLRSKTSVPPAGRYLIRTSDRTLAPVARKIRKQTHSISLVGMRCNFERTGRHASTKTQSHAAFSETPTYSRGWTIRGQLMQAPVVLAVRRLMTVGMPHWKRLTKRNAKLNRLKIVTLPTMT